MARGSLDHRVLIASLRAKVQLLKNEKPTKRVSRGVFGPTYAGELSEDDESAPVSPRRRRQSKQQRQESPIRRELTVCKGCDARHGPTCWYLNPEKAPAWFTPNQDRLNLVEER